MLSCSYKLQRKGKQMAITKILRDMNGWAIGHTEVTVESTDETIARITNRNYKEARRQQEIADFQAFQMHACTFSESVWNS